MRRQRDEPYQERTARQALVKGWRGAARHPDHLVVERRQANKTSPACG
jgi:ribosome modulation factor